MIDAFGFRPLPYGPKRKEAEAKREANRSNFEHAESVVSSAIAFFDDAKAQLQSMMGIDRVRDGPHGFISTSACESLQLLRSCLQNLLRLQARFHVPKDAWTLDSLLTVAVEHFFSDMRAVEPTPTALDFARHFAPVTEQLIMKLTQCNFIFFRDSRSYYPLPPSTPEFVHLPKVPIPKSNCFLPIMCMLLSS